MADKPFPPQPIDPEMVAYVAKIAGVLHELRSLKLSYGEFYIERVTFGYDGESDGRLAIVPTEWDTLGIEVTP